MPGRRRKKRILIVDDDERSREAVRRALDRAGFRVEAAANGLELVASLNVVRPDLIILDTDLGWVSGVELCRLIGRIKVYEEIPMVFVSRDGAEPWAERCREAGAVAFFTKPVNVTELLQSVKRHVGLKTADGADPT